MRKEFVMMKCRGRVNAILDPYASTITLLKRHFPSVSSCLCTGCPTVKLPVGTASVSPGVFGFFQIFPHSLAAGVTWVRKSDSKQESHQSSANIDKKTMSEMD